jgi:hypothetical protein
MVNQPVIANPVKADKGLVIFIHGLGGDPQETWGNFPRFILSDPRVSNQFETAFFSFPTSLFGKGPKIQEVAAGLRTKIENDYEYYENISLVCHSLGGLIAKRYLIEEVKAERSLRVSSIALFAVPSNGAGIAKAGNFISWRSKQLKQLFKDADIIELLNEDWIRFGIQKKVRTKFIIGSGDQVVDRLSAAGVWANPDVYTVLGPGHIDLVKPKEPTDTAVIILKRFLLSSATTPSKPEPPPNVEHLIQPNQPDLLTLEVVAPQVASQNSIQQAFKKHGTDWPQVTIKWPSSTDDLVASLDSALERFDQDAGSLDGAEKFVRQVPTILGSISEMRERAERCLPAMVNRLKGFDARHREIAVASYLLYANFAIHDPANYYASNWLGMQELGIEIPPAWALLYKDGSEGRLAKVLGTSDGLADSLARLVKLGQLNVNYPPDSHGVDILMPNRLAEATLDGELSQENFCRWVVPQLEFRTSGTLDLPSAYTTWTFYKVIKLP